MESTIDATASFIVPTGIFVPPYQPFDNKWPPKDDVVLSDDEEAGQDAYAGGYNPYRSITLSCGCATQIGIIGCAEEAILAAYPFLGDMPSDTVDDDGELQKDWEWRPADDFQVILICGNCERQLTPPTSAWCIHQYHGWAQWLAVNE